MSREKFAVTAGQNGNPGLSAQARRWAEELQIPYVGRAGQNLKALLMEYDLTGLIVATKQGPVLHSPDAAFSFHPGMAALRLLNLERGGDDHLARALELRSGMRVLDCTLGQGSDALVIAALCGMDGKVVGAEASLGLWFVTSWGLKHYLHKAPAVTAACRAIECVCARAEKLLADFPADSFDAVYFDPMFRLPVQASSNMAPLRSFAFPGALLPATIEKALRVAPLVVVKERSEGVLRSLGMTEILGGRYSKIRYGRRRRQ